MRQYKLDDIIKIAEEKGLVFLDTEFHNLSEKHNWQCKKCKRVFINSVMNVRRNTKSECTKCINCSKRRYDLNRVKELAEKRGVVFLSTTVQTSVDKYLWQCSNGHLWKTTLDSIRNGYGCPYCKNSVSEEKCRFAIESITGRRFFGDRIILGGLELDGFCEELMIAFEHQGKQHYERDHYYKSDSRFTQQQWRDKRKIKLCLEKHIKLIIIPYYISKYIKKLEPYLRQQLPEFNTKIEWDNFQPNPSIMDQLRNILDKQDTDCLSTSYLGHDQNLLLRCRKCNFEWERNPMCIRKTKGCPKCVGRGTKKLSLSDIHKICADRNISFNSQVFEGSHERYDYSCDICSHQWRSVIWHVRKAKCCPKCSRRSSE